MSETKTIETIRDSYTFLQSSIFFEILAKTQIKNYPEILRKNNPPFTIDFDTGNQYVLRNDHIIRAIEISNGKGAGFGLIAEIGLIQSFTDIISKFSELLDTRNAGSLKFENYCKNKLGIQFNSFYSIIKLFRNIFVHSISREYKLKIKDFKEWKEYQQRKGVELIRFNVTITHNPPHAIDLQIKVSEIQEGITIWSIIGAGGMLMLIELIMNLCFEFEQINLSQK